MRMIPDELAKAIRPLQRLLKLLWFGQFFSLGIYIFITMQKVAAMGDKAAKMSPVCGRA